MRTLLLGVVIGVLAGLSIWWADQSDDTSAVAVSFQDEQVLDYYVQNLTATTLDEQGNPLRTLQVKALQHFRGNAGTLLQQPVLVWHTKTGVPWRLVAERGLLADTGDELWLQGAVQVSRPEVSTAAAMQLNTRNVRVVLPEHFIETAEWVEWVSTDYQLQATGLRAWLQSPVRLEWLQDVSAWYGSNAAFSADAASE